MIINLLPSMNDLLSLIWTGKAAPKPDNPKADKPTRLKLRQKLAVVYKYGQSTSFYCHGEDFYLDGSKFASAEDELADRVMKARENLWKRGIRKDDIIHPPSAILHVKLGEIEDVSSE